MSSVIVISDDEQEKPTSPRHPILSSPIPPERFLANEPLTEKAEVKREVGQSIQRKKRRISESSVEHVEIKDVSKAKKMRRDEYKAVSVSFR